MSTVTTRQNATTHPPLPQLRRPGDGPVDTVFTKLDILQFDIIFNSVILLIMEITTLFSSLGWRQLKIIIQNMDGTTLFAGLVLSLTNQDHI